ncbi:MAG: UPF0104 family protein [Comamonadaceae bacterium]|nr:MAG: UPF0104 family protein [Comamonadaceae bacterium]
MTQAPATGKPLVPEGRRPMLARWRGTRWWPWAQRLLIGGFAVFVVSLLVVQAREIEWQQVFATMRAYPVGTLLAALALAVLSHVVYSCFDLIGRHYTGHVLRAPTVMAITFVSYAFNLNLGTVVGAVAMRVRLYSRLGLEAGTVARIVGFSMLTNWLGYFLLAGLAFLWWPLALPEDWHVGVAALRTIGVSLLAVVLAYLGLCLFSKRREWSVRGHEIGLPGLRVALLQLLLSTSNWAVMGSIMFVLLQGRVAYPMTLGVLLIGAIAGLMSRVPAGLGVLEAVFLALLAQRLPNTSLIAAVLTYRAVYYWIPLVIAGLLYVLMEASARRMAPDLTDD